MAEAQEATAELMENHLVASVHEYLQLHLTKNSIFLAERLVAQFPSEDNVHLLATCYHRSGQTYRAYHLLRGSLTGLGYFLTIPCVACPNDGCWRIHFNHVFI